MISIVHVVLIVGEDVTAVQHAGFVIVCDAARLTVAARRHDDIVMDVVSSRRMLTVSSRASVLLDQSYAVKSADMSTLFP